MVGHGLQLTIYGNAPNCILQAGVFQSSDEQTESDYDENTIPKGVLKMPE